MKVFFGFFLHKKSTILSPPNHHKLYTLNSQLYTLFGRSGKAVGLSAISLLAFCFLLTQKNPLSVDRCLLT